MVTTITCMVNCWVSFSACLLKWPRPVAMVSSISETNCARRGSDCQLSPAWCRVPRIGAYRSIHCDLETRQSGAAKYKEVLVLVSFLYSCLNMLSLSKA